MEKYEKSLPKIVIIFTLTISIIVIGWIAIFYEINNHKNNLIDTFSEEQYSVNNQLSDRVQNALNNYIKNKKTTTDVAEQKVINEIIKKEVNSKNKYIFFYGNDYVLFERDKQVTDIYKGRKLKEVFNLWKYNNINNLNSVENLMYSGVNGKDKVIKNDEPGSEIISWCNFKVLNKKYILGISTSEDYLLNSTLFNQHTIRIYIIGGMFTMVIIILSIIFSLYIHSKSREVHKLKSKIKESNVQISEFTHKINKMKKTIEITSVYDFIPKVYNQSFFYNIILKSNEKIFLPIAVIRLDIVDLNNIRWVMGIEEEHEVLEAIVKILIKSCGESSIVSRVGYNEFVILMINTDEKQALEVVDNIKHELQNSYIKFLCKILLGFEIKNYETENLIDIVKLAKRKMRKFKL